MKISACMIVKNGGERLKECIARVAMFADELCVVDTGSTDGTLDYLKSLDSSFIRLMESPWRDNFSLHRNQSLDLASGDWIFIVDHDEVLDEEGAKVVRDAVKQAEADGNNCLFIDICNVYGPNDELADIAPQLRFFRRDNGWKYNGPVHNKLELGDVKPRISRSNIRLYHYGYGLPPEEMKKKADRERRVLRAWLRDHPDDFSRLYQLANSLLYNVNQFNRDDFKELESVALRAIELTAPEETGDGRVRVKEGFGLHIMTRSVLAWAYHHMGLYEKSCSTVMRCLELKPDFLDGMICLAFNHYALGNLGTAEGWARRYLDAQPRYDTGASLDNVFLRFAFNRPAAYQVLADISHLRGEAADREMYQQWALVERQKRMVPHSAPQSDGGGGSTAPAE